MADPQGPTIQIGGVTVSVADRVAFAHPVVFSSEQRLASRAIAAKGEGRGALLLHDGAAWGALGGGRQGDALVWSGDSPTWAPVDLAGARGRLSADKGGTGLAVHAAGSLLVGDGEGLASLAAGSEGEALVCVGGQPAWRHVGDVRGRGAKGRLAGWADEGFLEDSGVSYGRGFLSLEGPNAAVGVGKASFAFVRGEAVVSLGKGSVRVLADGTTRLGSVAFDAEGLASGLRVPASAIEGALPARAGGTGVLAFEAGSLVYARSEGEIGFVRPVEGGVLGYRGGRFVWGDPVVAREGPLRALPHEPSADVAEGTLATESGRLTYVDGAMSRRAVLLQGDPLEGTAENVRGVVGTAQGGTGRDLGAARLGSLLYAAGPRVGALEAPEGGGYLHWGADDALPSFRAGTDEVRGEGGVKAVQSAGVARVELDLDASLAWRGAHSFAEASVVGAPLSLAQEDGPHIRFASRLVPTFPQPGDVWWDGLALRLRTEGATVELGAPVAPPAARQLVAEVAFAVATSDRRIAAPYVVPFGDDGASMVTWRVRRVCLERTAADPSLALCVGVTADGLAMLDPAPTFQAGQASLSTADVALPTLHSGQRVRLWYVSGPDDLLGCRLYLERV